MTKRVLEPTIVDVTVEKSSPKATEAHVTVLLNTGDSEVLCTVRDFFDGDEPAPDFALLLGMTRKEAVHWLRDNGHCFSKTSSNSVSFQEAS